MTSHTEERFPTQVEYGSPVCRALTYYATGKTGTNRATGLRAAEMEADDMSRIWVTADGQVFPE